ncbi:MAG: glycine--tRNA ligase subunit beta [Gammaproteobacteria bacterium]
MTARRDLLIEIGTEELPPWALRQLAAAFADGIRQGLDNHNLRHGDCRWYATPRRLAVAVDRLATAQDDHEVVRRGPALNAAYDADGNPTRAAQGFARSCGTGVDKLEVLETDKGSWLAYRTLERGRSAAEHLPGIINDALARLPIPKRMRWGEGEAEFVRPVHWSVVLLGRDAVPCQLLGTEAGNASRGHRFHHPGPVRITSAATYAKKLKDKARVLADFDERRALIREQAEAAAAELDGTALLDEDLLDEVTALVEWPAAVSGSFDRKFLALPEEVLIATMQDHQKYFPVTDAGGGLMPYFITIANIDSLDPLEVRRGNERVIRPRLSDAAFFWDRDRRTPLSERRAQLKDVVFQQKLGSLEDKTRRVTALAGYIAGQLGLDVSLAERAAELARCDLFTEMVGEFPKLQGVMGRHYARHDGEPEEVALALDEQYRPRFAGDGIPAIDAGRVLALADRIDTLAGIFAIGKAPTGDSDPFGLRRAALGCLRILVEASLDLDLAMCLQRAAAGFPADVNAGTVIDEVFDFMMERLRHYYLEEGIRPDVFDAVLSRRPPRPFDFHQRIHAVTAFTRLPEAESLASANKRIRNILRQSGETPPGSIDTSRLQEPAETALAEELETTAATVQPLLESNDYTRALTKLAGLRDKVDGFFDNVMVMSEDHTLRSNRLAMLQRISELFLSIADISRLQSAS